MLVEPGLYIGGSQEGTSPKDVKNLKEGVQFVGERVVIGSSRPL